MLRVLRESSVGECLIDAPYPCADVDGLIALAAHGQGRPVQHNCDFDLHACFNSNECLLKWQAPTWLNLKGVANVSLYDDCSRSDLVWPS